MVPPAATEALAALAAILLMAQPDMGATAALAGPVVEGLMALAV